MSAAPLLPVPQPPCWGCLSSTSAREELPLGAMAGITRDILGREVLLWLMAGSSRWSWETGRRGTDVARSPHPLPQPHTAHPAGELELTLRKDTT